MYIEGATELSINDMFPTDEEYNRCPTCKGTQFFPSIISVPERSVGIGGYHRACPTCGGKGFAREQQKTENQDIYADYTENSIIVRWLDPSERRVNVTITKFSKENLEYWEKTKPNLLKVVMCGEVGIFSIFTDGTVLVSKGTVFVDKGDP